MDGESARPGRFSVSAGTTKTLRYYLVDERDAGRRSAKHDQRYECPQGGTMDVAIHSNVGPDGSLTVQARFPGQEDATRPCWPVDRRNLPCCSNGPKQSWEE